MNALLPKDEGPDKGVDEFEIYYQKGRTEGMYKWRPVLVGVEGWFHRGNEKL